LGWLPTTTTWIGDFSIEASYSYKSKVWIDRLENKPGAWFLEGTATGLKKGEF
jgi:hypothetical protein